MRERIAAAVGPLLGFVLFVVAIWLLHSELEEYHLRDVLANLEAIPRGRVSLAIVLTVIGYLSLTCYDTLAFRWIRHPLDYPRIALASFIAYVFSHNVGLSFFGGSAVRYRMFTTWGVRPAEIARAISLNVITFWLGFLALGGSALWLDPIPIPGAWHPLFATSRPVGVIMLVLLAAYALQTLRRKRLVRVRGFELELPGIGMTAAQLAVSVIDWALAAGVLFVLLPPVAELRYSAVLGSFLLAQLLGLISHVPAGLGVFDTAIVLLLTNWLPGDQALGGVIAYRIIYYLMPLALAVPLFVGYELLQRRRALARARSVLAAWIPEVVPRMLAVSTFSGGVVLLLSGATPAAPGRVELLERLIPLPAMEVSHLVGSVVGLALLWLARGLQQRVDAAYWGTLILLIGGATASLLKGLDWEEAALLVAMAAALAPCRRYFYRRSSLFAQSFSPSWMVGIAAVIVATVFVMLLANRDVNYAHELWWQFEVDAHAPRSLRALAAGALVLVTFALARLLRPVAPLQALPSETELDRVAALASISPHASAYLALLGDKHLLFHESGAGFLMYGVHGRGWVSMGDPIGPPEVRRELAWRFRELADQNSGLAIFYEVRDESLPLYLDLGLNLRKLGEEARVPLDDFSLAHPSRKRLRQAMSRMRREGCRFELIPAAGVPPILDELGAISDRWLAAKHTREKRFSLGYFDRTYITRLPVAVVKRGEQIVAFANVLAGENKAELSVDLMRYVEDAPPGVMESLFTELMLWGHSQGYHWFDLGMAPLAGFERHRLAPLWNKLGALLFRHGENFYNFQGLRAFKEKFDPVWDPCYLASPGGLAIPFALGHVAALVNAGVSGLVTR
jgi:phosphatidylglycerol lysyltransferase